MREAGRAAACRRPGRSACTTAPRQTLCRAAQGRSPAQRLAPGPVPEPPPGWRPWLQPALGSPAPRQRTAQPQQWDMAASWERLGGCVRAHRMLANQQRPALLTSACAACMHHVRRQTAAGRRGAAKPARLDHLSLHVFVQQPPQPLKFLLREAHRQDRLHGIVVEPGTWWAAYTGGRLCWRSTCMRGRAPGFQGQARCVCESPTSGPKASSLVPSREPVLLASRGTILPSSSSSKNTCSLSAALLLLLLPPNKPPNRPERGGGRRRSAADGCHCRDRKGLAACRCAASLPATLCAQTAAPAPADSTRGDIAERAWLQTHGACTIGDVTIWIGQCAGRCRPMKTAPPLAVTHAEPEMRHHASLPIQNIR